MIKNGAHGIRQQGLRHTQIWCLCLRHHLPSSSSNICMILMNIKRTTYTCTSSCLACLLLVCWSFVFLLRSSHQISSSLDHSHLALSSICGVFLLLKYMSCLGSVLEMFKSLYSLQTCQTVSSAVTPSTLCSSDLAVPHPDKKSVIMYVTSLFQVLPQSISMEAIKEVETLPRATPGNVSRVTTEEHYEIQTQQRFSQQVRHSGPC